MQTQTLLGSNQNENDQLQPDFVLNVLQTSDRYLDWQAVFTKEQFAKLIASGNLEISFDESAASQAQFQLLKTFNDHHYQQFHDTNTWQLFLTTALIEIHHPPSQQVILSPWIVCPLNISFNFNQAIIKIDQWQYNDKLWNHLNQLQKQHHFVFVQPQLGDHDQIKQFFHTNDKWSYQESLTISTFDRPQPLAKTITFNYHQGFFIFNFNPHGDHISRQLNTLIQTHPDLEKTLLDNGSIDNQFFTKQLEDLMIANRGQYLYKISPTNYQQDLAILGALNYHTFIEGPPGSGKTQCLTNLIVNILLEQKRALVSSQKQVALDILLTKLGPLKNFVLNLNSTTLIKSNFYHQVRSTWKLIKQYPNEINPVEKTYNYDDQEWQLLDQAFYQNQVENDNPSTTNQWFKDQIQYADHFATWLEVNQLEPLINDPKSDHHPNKQRWWKKWKKTAPEHQNPDSNDDQNHPQYPKWQAFKATFANQEQYQSAYQRYQYWQTKVNQSTTNNLSKINNIDLVFHQIHHQIGATINKEYDQPGAAYEQYLAFTKALESEILPPLKFIAKFSPMINRLFPIVMANAAINFDPYPYQSFDYVIIDEASQLPKATGLVLLSLGKIRVLAGDQMQLPPLNYFEKQTIDQQWGKIESILQYAKTMPIYHVMLDKTYRAKRAQLMTFNAHHFYDDRLDISDEFVYEPDRSVIVNTITPLQISQTLTQIKAHPEQLEAKLYQQFKTSFPKANFWELRAVSSYLFKYYFQAVDDYYELKSDPDLVTMIVVLANQIQQNALEKYLQIKFNNRLDHLINQQKLIIKNLTNIQGIEADVVILSLTYNQQTKFKQTIFAKRGGQNALNVATSRARSQLIIIKSIMHHDISLIDAPYDLQIFAKYLQFLEQTPVQRQLYRYQQQSISPLSLVEPSAAYPLKNQIKDLLSPYLNQVSVDQVQSSNLKIFENYYVATLPVDLALVDQSRNLVVLAFLINQGVDLKTFWLIKDRFLYLKQRRFNVFMVNNESDFSTISNEIKQAMSYYEAKKGAIKIKTISAEAKTNLPLRLMEISGGINDEWFANQNDEQLKKK